MSARPDSLKRRIVNPSRLQTATARKMTKISSMPSRLGIRNEAGERCRHDESKTNDSKAAHAAE